MKRIGRPEQRPFIIRRDGTLIDRDSGTRIGIVYRDRFEGWLAVSTFDGTREFLGHGVQSGAAQRAWDYWQRSQHGTLTHATAPALS